MNLSWLLALPTAFLASSSRLRSSGGMRALWLALSRTDRILIGVLLALLVVWTFVAFSNRLGHGRRRALWTLTGTTGLFFAALVWWAFRLPQPKTGVFILWHQLVRGGAVVAGVIGLFGAMGLLLPRVLDGVEQRGFVPFVAVRHVRRGPSRRSRGRSR